METPKTKTTIKQRVISFGERMHNYRLLRAQQIKDAKALKRAKKVSHSKPDNL